MSSAGFLNLNVEDTEKRLAFPVLVMYPGQSASSAMQLGPFTINATVGAAVAPGPHRVVIISHGSGGTNMGYLGIAQTLVDAGYIVAMPEHFGNNRNSNELADSTANLQYRPRHISKVIDALAAAPRLRGHVNVEQVGIIGHSMGGYTALAVAGGTPWSRMREKIEVTHDDRIKAIALLAPATDFFIPGGSLENVTVPVFVRTAERDYITPPIHGERVLQQVRDPALVDIEVIDNANHFSFMSPFPDSMQSPDFAPGNDPAGFDRPAYQKILTQQLVAFMTRSL